MVLKKHYPFSVVSIKITEPLLSILVTAYSENLDRNHLSRYLHLFQVILNLIRSQPPLFQGGTANLNPGSGELLPAPPLVPLPPENTRMVLGCILPDDGIRIFLCKAAGFYP